MSSSDDDDLFEGFKCVMFKDRPEWKDIIPIPQDDGPYPVVRIAYTEVFQDVFDYFRAIVAKGELSERALQLTAEALRLNAANYTVWQYRRKIIKHINYNLNKELEFCRDMIELHPKNYQVWHHRRVIVQWLDDPSKELRLTRIIFASDAKNYHAWEHNQWVLKTFNLYENELEFVDDLIQDDIRNNSAWNQRYFVISRTSGFTNEVLEREIEYAQNAINKVVNNESSWSYLKGIFAHGSKRLSDYSDIEKWCWDLHKVKGHNSPYLITFILDILEDKLEANSNAKELYLDEALKLCDSLANDHDKIRQEYWRYMGRRLSSKYGINEH